MSSNCSTLYKFSRASVLTRSRDLKAGLFESVRLAEHLFKQGKFTTGLKDVCSLLMCSMYYLIVIEIDTFKMIFACLFSFILKKMLKILSILLFPFKVSMAKDVLFQKHFWSIIFSFFFVIYKCTQCNLITKIIIMMT